MEASNLHHRYGRRTVLRGVDIRLQGGVLAGVVGENGAGKSTLLKILAGELRPDRGTVHHHGGFGYCPQSVVLNGSLTVRHHLELFRTAYGLPDLHRAREIMERLHFADYLDERAEALSGGTQQKLNLTLALMHDPQTLLLDEPYQGFDWDVYLSFWDLASHLRDAGRSVLVVSHLAHDTDRLDELWHLDRGVLRAQRKEPV